MKNAPLVICKASILDRAESPACCRLKVAGIDDGCLVESLF